MGPMCRTYTLQSLQTVTEQRLRFTTNSVLHINLFKNNISWTQNCCKKTNGANQFEILCGDFNISNKENEIFELNDKWYESWIVDGSISEKKVQRIGTVQR